MSALPARRRTPPSRRTARFRNAGSDCRGGGPLVGGPGRVLARRDLVAVRLRQGDLAARCFHVSPQQQSLPGDVVDGDLRAASELVRVSHSVGARRRRHGGAGGAGGAAWGWLAAGVACLLTGSSYMLIVYASEARGYALAGFSPHGGVSAVGSILAGTSCRPRDADGDAARQRGGEGDSDRRRIACWRFGDDVRAFRGSPALFGLCVVLGVLSHLTFIQFYAGAVAWKTGWGWCVRRPVGGGEFVARRAACPGPTLAIVGLYFARYPRHVVRRRRFVRHARSDREGDGGVAVGCVAHSYWIVLPCGEARSRRRWPRW